MSGQSRLLRGPRSAGKPDPDGVGFVPATDNSHIVSCKIRVVPIN